MAHTLLDTGVVSWLTRQMIQNPPPTTRSHLFLRVEHLLGSSLIGFIAQRRKVVPPATEPIPYRRIAYELVQLTGVDITHEAVRRWHRSTEE